AATVEQALTNQVRPCATALRIGIANPVVGTERFDGILVLAAWTQQEPRDREVRGRGVARQRALFFDGRHRVTAVEDVGRAMPGQDGEVFRLKEAGVANLDRVAPALRQPAQEDLQRL